MSSRPTSRRHIRHGCFVLSVPPYSEVNLPREVHKESHFNVRFFQKQPGGWAPEHLANFAADKATRVLKEAFDNVIRNVSEICPDFLLQLWIDYIYLRMPLDVKAPWGFPANWNLPLGSSAVFFDLLKQDIAQAFQEAEMVRQPKDEENEKMNFIVRRELTPPRSSSNLRSAAGLE